MEVISIIKWVIVAITSLAAAYFLVCYVRFRLPAGGTETIEGEIFYKFADVQPGPQHHRQTFEEMFLGKSSIRLSDRSQWFVSKKDRAKAWPESPHAMLEKGYTMKVALKVKPLRFGGYGPATIVAAEKIEKQPMVGK